MGDETGLRQVFLNLAMNAFRHAPEGGYLRIVSRRINRHGALWARVGFGDNGCGIGSDAIAHIFEPGFSATSQTSGLGLTVSRRIVEQHGGDLSVRSEVGRGSIFSIEVPSE